jgi:phosphonoacetaldehyde hydrolase
MKFEAVIFDWAGTTVDYGCFAPVQTFIEVFKEYGITPTMEETRKPMGMLKWDHIKTMLSMERINQEFQKIYGRKPEDDDVTAMHDLFLSKLLRVLNLFAEPKEYVLETVEKLRNAGIKIGSTTGYTDQMMEIVVREAKKAGYEPDCIITPDSVSHMGRPYPYMIFKNMEALKVTSIKKVLKVGDTISDILEAKNAGVMAVGIVEGSSEMGLTKAEYEALPDVERSVRAEAVRARYIEAGADYVITDIRGVLKLVSCN